MSKFKKTIFLPSIEGQHKLWKSEIAPACNDADEVVQLGNVIGCDDVARDKKTLGPNEAVLKYLILYRSTQDKWTQIVGTNEMAALNFPDEWTNATSRQILRNSWFAKEPRMVTASVNKGRLVTHGGLTYGEWLSIGSPDTAEEAAGRLNEKYYGTVYQGSCFKLGNAPNFSANPIWCDPVMEMYPSWITAPVAMPFGQVHGSNNLNSVESRALISDKHSPLSFFDQVRFTSYGSRVFIKGIQILGVNLELPKKLISSVPQPQSLYIEKLDIGR